MPKKMNVGIERNFCLEKHINKANTFGGMPNMVIPNVTTRTT